MGVLNEQQAGAISALYHEMFQKLYIYANASLQDRSLAEEAVQETFRIACEKAAECLLSENPAGWLMATLKNVLYSTKRHRAVLSKYFLQTAQAQEDNGQPMLELPVYDEVDAVTLFSGSVPRKEILLLKKLVIDKSSYLEVSRDLGISVNACKMKVRRIKNKLKKDMEKD